MTTSPDFLKYERTSSFPTLIDDLSVTDSDLGSSASHADREQKDSIDYWFGKKYLECLIAETLLHDTKLQETFTEFDVKLNMCLGNYPYAQCWTFLQSLGLGTGVAHSNSSDRACIESLLRVVGTTIRIGSAAEKDAMLSKLRDMCESTSEPRDEHIGNDSRVPIVESEPHRVRGEEVGFGNSVSSGTRDVSMYSMALKEHGDRIGILPEYHISPTISNPPGFAATLRFCGIMARGTGRTKKAAQHLAAKDVCNALQINPWS